MISEQESQRKPHPSFMERGKSGSEDPARQDPSSWAPSRALQEGLVGGEAQGHQPAVLGSSPALPFTVQNRYVTSDEPLGDTEYQLRHLDNEQANRSLDSNSRSILWWGPNRIVTALG